MSEIQKSFKNPGPAYRGKPFWSWNGKLDKDELIRQAHLLKDMGFGGFFMHSRTGLETQYLGDEWFEITNAVADEAEKIGMEAWLYDEDRWPSGYAGGLVTKNPEFRMKVMQMHIIPAAEFKTDSNTVACYAANIDGKTLIDYKLIHKPAETKGYEFVLVFTLAMLENTDMYNEYTYPDTMNKDAIAAFIECTHEQYKKKCGDRLGKSIYGIFTDEPYRGTVFEGNDPNGARAPYTYNLFGIFKERYGYDLLDYLPEVFFIYKGEKVNQVTWHYMELLQELFCENFSQQLEDWCNDNNMIFTGHYWQEESLQFQVMLNGSIMRGYEIMSYPGVDMLTEGDRNMNIMKQLNSVAHQTGKKWLMSELYGCTGWQFDLESHKNVGDWQALMGITLRCHHLSWYTMKGEAKRDFPASISYQSAWYDEYKRVEDYFARFGVIMTNTKPVCDVLYVTPIESMMSMVYPGWNQGDDEDVARIEKTYKSLSDYMYNAQIDFDFGDEDIISRRGTVEEADGHVYFRVGEAKYATVVIGGMLTMRQSTYKLLEEFAAKGGRIVFAGDAPAYIDAKVDNRVIALSEKAVVTSTVENEFLAAVKNENAVVTVDTKGVLLQTREDEDGKLYAIVLNPFNREGGAAENVTIRIKKGGYLERWDMFTADQYFVEKGDSFELNVPMPEGQEYVFVVNPKDEHLPVEEKTEIADTVELSEITGYELTEENMLMLDMATYKIDDEPWQEKKEVLRIDAAVRERFGLPLRSGIMLQPWCIVDREHPVHGKVSLSFKFDIKDMPNTPLYLCMELPETLNVTVNGKKLDTTNDVGMWVDIAFRRIPLDQSMLKTGTNEIIVEHQFTEMSDIEAIYLIGNFGVSVDGCYNTVTSLPKNLKFGDITSQGLPFYGGKIRYHLAAPKATKAMLQTESVDAGCIVVNPETDNTFLTWKPYTAKATSDGEIIVEVSLTRRNTFGPLHQYPLDMWAYGPWSFTYDGDKYKDDYNLYPCGILKAPKLHILK